MNRKQRRAARRAGAPSATRSGNQVFAAAIACHQDGQLDQAEAGYRSVLLNQPEHAESLHYLGIIAKQRGNLADGVDLVRQALAIRPAYPEAYSNLGLMLREQGALAAAAAAHLQAIDLHPQFAEAHNNLATVRKQQGRLGEAVAGYEAAVSIRQDYVDAWSNLGVVYRDIGRLEDAERCLQRALTLHPGFAEAHMNLGTLYKDTNRLDAAVVSHRRAVELAPAHSLAHYNLGLSLVERGNLSDAIGSLRRAADLDPGFAAAFCDLGVALQRTGEIDASIEKLVAALGLDPASVIAWDNLTIGLETLVYERRRDDATIADGLAVLDQRLSDASELDILKCRLDSRSSNRAAGYEKVRARMAVAASRSSQTVVALFNYGRSGSGLLDSLIDGHPQVASIPGVLMKGFFARGVWEALNAEGSGELLPRFMETYEVLFDAASSKPVPTGVPREDTVGIGRTEGLTNLGPNGDEVMSVDRAAFHAAASQMIATAGEVDQGTLFRIVHRAYEAAAGGDGAEKPVLFYHIHNPAEYPLANFLGHFPEARLLMTVREPIQSCESWLLREFESPAAYNEICHRIERILSLYSDVNFQFQPSAALRLEDLKTEPEATISRLCAWIGIDEAPSLYTQTALGRKWWGDPSGLDYARAKGGSPFAKASLDYPPGRVFSERDLLVLTTLLEPFRVHAGYAAADASAFEANLQRIRPLLDQPMDFERRLFEAAAGPDDPTRQVAYRHFHGFLIARWTQLAGQTEPEPMITLL